MLEGTTVTWEDIGAIIAVAAMFAAYLYYIHFIYPRSLTKEIDKVEREYYECYDIYVAQETATSKWAGPHEEHDPGDEQPQR